MGLISDTGGIPVSSASLATPTRSSSPGYSNRKWGVSGKSLPVIRLWSIRMLDFNTLRHTFLTVAVEDTDAFTLQYIAGHDTIKTTMRYVHPRAESVS